jgi:hypothetical protein
VLSGRVAFAELQCNPGENPSDIAQRKSECRELAFWSPAKSYTLDEA